MTTELLKRDAAVNVTHVPYRGTNAALADLIAGQIDTIFGEVSMMAPNIAVLERRMALSITSPETVQAFALGPDHERSRHPFVDRRKLGRIARASARPGRRSDPLEQSLQKALREPSFRNAADKQGWSQVAGTRQEFAELLARETDQAKPGCRSPGFQLD